MEEYNLIVFGEMVVGDGDGGGSLDGIDQSILTMGHGIMVNPNVGWTINGDSITITSASIAKVIDRIPNKSSWAWNNVVNVEAMDDHILDELNCNAGTIGDMDIDSPSINGFVTGHDQLLIQPNYHTASKHNPQRPWLDHGMA